MGKSSTDFPLSDLQVRDPDETKRVVETMLAGLEPGEAQ
jgi:hypothetical protein